MANKILLTSLLLSNFLMIAQENDCLALKEAYKKAFAGDIFYDHSTSHIMEYIESECSDDINSQDCNLVDRRGISTLMIVARHGSLKDFNKILTRESLKDINKQSPDYKSTLLHFAVSCNTNSLPKRSEKESIKIIHLLLSLGADTNIKNIHDETVLMRAKRNNLHEVVAYLTSVGVEK
ncbi:ankyrin repeat domain-containing protein [Candidatus Chromulinivorax destructor]|uniref:Uncharacterized protein n=1 Tax=Candidatus Chromulinivorax destructor TaxID=2066483 RepID=A0A345ZAJ1_9BACT|nr:ankyrin repeat domain-containing protein [Candidatus Chromulinivorax destructor]AXK60308.1 hypothetical protein C0J27_00890 [Candidatus Chromulinivorax destructor]